MLDPIFFPVMGVSVLIALTFSVLLLAIQRLRAKKPYFLRYFLVTLTACFLLFLFKLSQVPPIIDYFDFSTQAIAWHPDGKLLAAGSSDLWIYDDKLNRIRQLVTSPEGGTIRSLSWSPDGTKLISASTEGLVSLYNANIGPSLGRIYGHQSTLSVAWSPDSTKIATGSTGPNGVIEIWDADSLKRQAAITDDSNYIQGLAWSPDGTKLVTCSSDNIIRIWDSAGKILKRLVAPSTSFIYSIAWSGDGMKLVASSDTAIFIWDTKTSRLLTTLKGGLVLGEVAWSPDGKLIAVVDINTLHIYDAANYNHLASLTGHAGFVVGLSWNPDSQRIASIGKDETIRIWDVVARKQQAILATGN